MAAAVSSTFSTWTNHFASNQRPPAGWSLDTRTDWQHDGQLVVAGGKTASPDSALGDLDHFVPSNGAEIQGDVVMVNGIMTDLALQSADLQAMADRGFRVVGVHNSTRGLVNDLAQCVGDKLNLHTAENKATTTTARLVQQAVETGRQLSLVGHSQGALIISAALYQVNKELAASGHSASEAEAKLAHIEVTTLGGAAATYPKGPTYAHHYNTSDLVPMVTGRPLWASLAPDSKESLHSFSACQPAGQLPPWSNGVTNRLARLVDATVHGASAVYLPRLDRVG